MGTNELQDLTPLLEAVQMSKIFADGKTYVDCRPKFPVTTIAKKYAEQKAANGFNLYAFVLDNFELPVAQSNGYNSNVNLPVEENINTLWDVLTRQPDVEGGSLIALPFPYVVPGGRFGEIYYWDSYFTMLGLRVSGKTEMISNMINNFSYLVDRYGYIPNGNRDYFLGRSQPPFYSLMIQLLAEIEGKEVLIAHLPQLEREYAFWMQDAPIVNNEMQSSAHNVWMPGGEILNRYWDENATPRPESFREDVELAEVAGKDSPSLYRHLRAGAESGWDFSCRWFRDKNVFETINTTSIVPVDLNVLLHNLEKTIAEAWLQQNDEASAAPYLLAAENRKNAILKYCWNETAGFYFDYDIELHEQKEVYSLAAMYPLYFGLASKEEAASVAAIIEKQFLHDGGLISTLETTGQQWDAPNGWAPLHWISIAGLDNYGYTDLATEIARRWLKLNTDVFRRTGKLMEKYNVVNTHLEAGGGEYPGQDGFGWTNGVFMALLKKYGSQ